MMFSIWNPTAGGVRWPSAGEGFFEWRGLNGGKSYPVFNEEQQPSLA